MGYGNPKRGHSLVLNDLQGLFQHKPRSVPVTSQDPPVLVTSQCRADLTEPPRGGAGAVGQRRTCRPHSAGGAGPASSCASGAAMRAQFASGTLTALQRVELLQQLEQAYERMMENRTAAARASLLKDAQQIRAERTAARKEELEQVGGSEGSSSQLGILTPLAVQEDLGPHPSGPWVPTRPALITAVVLQEKQLIAQLEEQLKAGSEEMEVVWRGEGSGAAHPRVVDMELSLLSARCCGGRNSACERSGRSWSWRVPGEWEPPMGPCTPRLHTGVSDTPGAAMGAALLGMGLCFLHGVAERPRPSPGVGTRCWGAPAVTEAGSLQPSLVAHRRQHQMELEVERVPGAVLPELVEAQLVRGRTHSTLTPSNRGLPGDRAPCSTVVLLGSRVLHEALLRSGP
ncbi:uncharacterized protein [Excalfactoria chinensis]|uniref:uncharacterized protein n=1 Tax=Excalfactoria chinensis TaxID=46218 RepID=UPI003B3AA54F